jgi:hypothetical protein
MSVAKAEEKPKPTAPLGANVLQLGEHQRNVWVAKIPMGVEPSDVLDPAYWAHHSGKLAPYDKIECRAEDGTWYQELIVMDSSRAWARVKPLMEVLRFATQDVGLSQTAPTGYEIVHRGPRKWSVIRSKDRQVMHEDEAVRDGAEQWLKENADKLKAATTPA